MQLLEEFIVNKILITIQGRNLILYYQIKQSLPSIEATLARYLHVSPTAELANFDLKGLTPEMFCVNIADMVNIQHLFEGQVENERQIPVARWKLNREEYLQAIHAPLKNLPHEKIVTLLAPLPGYQRETGNQYIDFEEQVVVHQTSESEHVGGYRLTIATEDVEGHFSTDAYYSLDTYTSQEWQNIPPPQKDHERIRDALNNTLQVIRNSGVEIGRVYDETDYVLANQVN